jgi:hypothetical protein
VASASAGVAETARVSDMMVDGLALLGVVVRAVVEGWSSHPRLAAALKW